MRVGVVAARTRYRDQDGRLRFVQASGSNRAAAERNLKTALSLRTARTSGVGSITGDSAFGKLVELRLEDLDLEGRIAPGTRELYEHPGPLHRKTKPREPVHSRDSRTTWPEGDAIEVGNVAVENTSENNSNN